jgi:ankyrin repeat protein
MRKSTAIDYPTILFYAISLGKPAFVAQLCFSDGIDPNRANSLGLTPIMKAIMEKKWDIVRTLLSHPALDLSIVIGTRTAMSMMIASGGDVPEFWRHPTLDLGEKVKGVFTLGQMITQGNLALFLTVLAPLDLESELYINAPDGNGKTLLHYAVEQEKKDFVKAILNHPGFRPFGDRITEGTVAKIVTKNSRIKNLIVERFKRF